MIIYLKVNKDKNNIFNNNLIFKNIVILVGDMGVGKSSLISQYIKKEFPESPLPTIAKIIKMRNGDKIKMQIWDTAGQEKYKSITSHHYKKAVGALLVYDITRRITFDDCIKWYTELKNYTDKECIICIVGNKIDIVQKNQNLRVSREEGENFSKKNNSLFYEMSAKKYDEINRCFEDLIKKIYEAKKENLKMSGKFSVNESFIVKEEIIKNNENHNYCF